MQRKRDVKSKEHRKKSSQNEVYNYCSHMKNKNEEMFKGMEPH
jgi:hypothetical protein